MTLYLVRHGSTEWSDSGRLNGWADVPLNARGIEQARALRAALPWGEQVPIWSSDLTRATMTAEILGPHRTDSRLRELDFGALDGLTWDRCEPAVQRALHDFEGFAAPGGESVAELASRIDRFLGELASGEHVLVTHGGVIRLLLRRTTGDAVVPPGGFVAIGGGGKGIAPSG